MVIEMDPLIFIMKSMNNIIRKWGVKLKGKSELKMWEKLQTFLDPFFVAFPSSVCAQYGHVTSCHVSERSYDRFLRKFLDRWTNLLHRWVQNGFLIIAKVSNSNTNNMLERKSVRRHHTSRGTILKLLGGKVIVTFLKIKESIFINKDKPKLNGTLSSAPLYLFT